MIIVATSLGTGSDLLGYVLIGSGALLIGFGLIASRIRNAKRRPSTST